MPRQRDPDPFTVNRRRLVGFGVALAVLAGIATVVLQAISTAQRRDHRERYEQVVAALRAAGEPVTYDEYLGGEVPEGENGAALFEEAWLFLENELAGDVEPPDRWDADEDWAARGAEGRAEVADAVHRVGPFYDLVRRALERPRLRFERTETPVPGLSTSGVGERLEDILLIEAWLHSLDRVATTEAERLDAFALRLVLAERLRGDESSAVFIGMASAKRAVASMRGHVEAGRVDPAAALARLESVRGADWQASLAPLLREERLRVMFLYDYLLDGGSMPRPGRDVSDIVAGVFGRGKPSRRPLASGDIDVVVRFCEGTQALLDDLPADPDARRLRYDGIAAADPAIFPTSKYPERIGRLDEKLVETEARVRLARVALAVAAHRRETGAWPASLDEVAPRLGGAVPSNPLTNLAFAYDAFTDGVDVGARTDPDAIVWRLRD